MEEDVVAKLVVVIEIFLTLGEGKDQLLQVALLNVDDIVWVAVVVQEFRRARKEIELSVNFTKEKNPSV